jgi:hypothetical protein
VVRVAEVVLARLQVVPVRGGLDALTGDRDERLTGEIGAVLRQQPPEHQLRLHEVALAEPVVADPPGGIHEVQRRPEVVGERLPDGVVAVERDGIGDPHALHRPADVVDVTLEGELRRMHAEDDQPLVPVLLRPRPNVRECAEPVDAGVGPEVDDDDAPAQRGGRQRLGVEPSGRAVELGRRAFRVRRQRGVVIRFTSPGVAGHVHSGHRRGRRSWCGSGRSTVAQDLG